MKPKHREAHSGSVQVGDVVAERYQVLRLIGAGGMGSVFEVRHQALGRSFAMKTIAAERAASSAMLARFRQEAGVVASLRHPNIVEVVDWVPLSDGTPAMIMEFMKGQDLDQRLEERGPLPWDLLARFGDQLLGALGVAHRAGIIHRDLKPANLFIVSDEGADERVKLLDFGVSKITHNNANLTNVGEVVGSPPFMAPEQFNREHGAVGPRSDVWAAGAILYQMATNARAFDATALWMLFDRILHGRKDPIVQHRPDAPLAFIELVDRVLSPDQARRIETAEELREGLAAALKPTLRALASQPAMPVLEPEHTPPPPRLWDESQEATMRRAKARLLPAIAAEPTPSPAAAAPGSLRWVQVAVASLAFVLVAAGLVAWRLSTLAVDLPTVQAPMSSPPPAVERPRPDPAPVEPARPIAPAVEREQPVAPPVATRPVQPAAMKLAPPLPPRPAKPAGHADRPRSEPAPRLPAPTKAAEPSPLDP